MNTKIPSHIEDYLKKEVYPQSEQPKNNVLKSVAKSLCIVGMVIGLLMTASEQPSLWPNFIGIVLLAVCATIYRVLNNKK